MTIQFLNYRSVDDLRRAIARWSMSQTRRWDVVVGVPRSGLLAASLVALETGSELMDLPAYLADASPWSGLRLGTRATAAERKVLIVDDSVNSGTEMARVRAAVRAAHPRDRVTFFAAYASPRGVARIDAYVEEVRLPRAFEWNIMTTSSALEHCCMDIDGVLCPDPSPSDNDDARRYERFLRAAPLRYKPRSKVKMLVTSRLEKYRAVTEDWLSRNGVDYANLVMLDLPSAAERRRKRAHAPFKSAVYVESDARLFIESSIEEGVLIHQLSQRPVFITDTREYLDVPAAPTRIAQRARAAISARARRAGL